MADYEPFPFQHAGTSHPVYVGGEGPPILLMHELPGLLHECRQLADKLVNVGFQVYMPLMFGEFDTPFSRQNGPQCSEAVYPPRVPFVGAKR